MTPMLFAGWWSLTWLKTCTTVIESVFGPVRTRPAQILRFPLEAVRPPIPAGSGRSAKILTLRR